MTKTADRTVIPFPPREAVPDQDSPTPWRVIPGHNGTATIHDANGNPLTIALNAKIAGRIVAAVNLVECAYRDVNIRHKMNLAENIFPPVNEPCARFSNQSCVYPIKGGRCVHCGGGEGVS